MMKATQLHRLVESSWYSETGPFLLLVPFAWVYAAVSFIRRVAYSCGLLNRPELSVAVIVVGNVSVGGTGKTPVVAWLTQQLVSRGYRPGIVSRGYGGHTHSLPKLVQTEDPAKYGDEPVLLARQTGCPVCVCIDRAKAVERLAEENVNVVVSDDGLQHYRMRRVLEIVVIDGERQFGNGRLLPAGPLRESVDRALQADALVINGSAGSLPGFQFQLENEGLVALDGRNRCPLETFAGRRVWAVAGIGNPQRFYREMRAAGIHIDEVDVPDHGLTDLAALLRTRQQPILMTEKDAVKYQTMNCADAWYLPVAARFEPEAEVSIMSLVQERLAL